MDIVELGMDVDSRPLKRTNAEMERFAQQGKRVDGAARGVEKSTGSMMAAMKRAAVAIGGVTAALAGARSALRASQQYTQMTNSLRSLGMSADQASSTLGQIADVANRTRAPLQATAQLYQRISIAGRDLGATQQQVLRFSENVGLALAQTGTSASQASGALLQLSQAMAGGVVRAEEFNSILEGAFPIAQAAADGIDEAAGSVGRLRQMVIEGKVSSDEFFQAILSQTDQLEAAFANTVPTIGQAFTVLGNNLTTFIGGMDQALGASAAVAQAIIVAAENLDRIASYAAVAATAFGVRYVGGLVAARVATLSFAGSLAVVRGALIRTGIGALVVGAGELVYQFGRLVNATGGFGAAMAALGQVADGVWEGIKTSAAAIPPALESVWKTIAAGFLKMVRSLSRAWADFLHGISQSAQEGLSNIPGMESTILALNNAAIKAGSGVNDLTARIEENQAAAAAAKEEAQNLVGQGWAKAAEGMQTLTTLMNTANESTEDGAAAASKLNDALEEIGDGSSGSGSAGSVAKGMEDAAEKTATFASTLQDAAMTAEEMGVERANILISGIDGIAGAFGDFVAGGLRNFKGFVESVWSSFKRLISDMIALAVRNRIMLSLGITAGGAGTAAAAGGAGGGGGLLSSLMGGGGGGMLGTLGSAAAGTVGTGFIGAAGNALGIGAAGFNPLAIGTNAALAGGGFMATLGAAMPLIAGVGLVIGLFSKKVKELDKGVRVTVDGMDALVETFRKTETSRLFGLLKSRSTNYDSAEAEIADPITSAVRQVQTSIMDTASVLGIGAEAFEGFSHRFKVSLKGLSKEEQQAAISDALGSMGDEFAAMAIGSMRAVERQVTERVATGRVYGQFERGRGNQTYKTVTRTVTEMVRTTSEFAREGETATETLERLASALIGVNRSMDMLGHQMFEASLAGADMASSLAEAFGGLQAMDSATTTFFNAFYTEAEQLAAITRRTANALAEHNLQMPTTRQQYRAMVEAMDLTTESGREAYATLVGLADSFDRLLPAIGNVTAAMMPLISGTTSAIDQMIAQAQSTVSAAQAAAREWFNVADSLRQLVYDITIGSRSLQEPDRQIEALRREMNRLFRGVLEGNIDMAKQFSGVADDFLGAALGQATTAGQARAIQARVANQLRFAAGVADLEGTAEELIAELAQQQVDLLTDLKNYLTSGQPLDPQIVGQYQSALVNLGQQINQAQQFSYAYLRERLRVVVDLIPQTSLPPDVQDIMQAAASGIQSTIDFAVRADELTPGLRWLAVNGASQHIKTLDFVVRDDLDPQTATIAAQTVSGLTKTIDMIVGSKIPDDVKEIALTGSSQLARTVTATLASDIDPWAKRLALQNVGTYDVAVRAALDPRIGPGVRRIALKDAGTYALMVQASLSPHIGPGVRKIILKNQGWYAVNVNAILAAGIPAELKKTLLQRNTEGVRAVTIAMGFKDAITPAHKQILFEAATTALRTIRAIVNPIGWGPQEILFMDALGGPEVVSRTLRASAVFAQAISADMGRVLRHGEKEEIRRNLLGRAWMEAVSADGQIILRHGDKELVARHMRGSAYLAPGAWSQDGQRLLRHGGRESVARHLRGAAYLAPGAWSEDGQRLLRHNNRESVARHMRGAAYLAPGAWSKDGRDLLRHGDEKSVFRTMRGRAWLEPGKFSADGLKLLRAETGQIRRIMKGAIDLSALGPRQRALLEAISGAASGKLFLDGGFVFDPSTAFSSLLTTKMQTPMSALSTRLTDLRAALVENTKAVSGADAARAARRAAGAARDAFNAKLGTLTVHNGNLIANPQQVRNLARTAGLNASGAISGVAQRLMQYSPAIKGVATTGAGIANYLFNLFKQHGGNVAVDRSDYRNLYSDVTKAGWDPVEHFQKWGRGEILAGKRQFKPQAFDWKSIGLNIPGFANGGMHAGGLRVVGENGRELEATGPARYYSASQTREMLGGDPALMREMIAELRALRDENSQLGIRANRYGKRTSETMEKWDRTGLPGTVLAEADW